MFLASKGTERADTRRKEAHNLTGTDLAFSL